MSYSIGPWLGKLQQVMANNVGSNLWLEKMQNLQTYAAIETKGRSHKTILAQNFLKLDLLLTCTIFVVLL
jgi:hypothetical protein